MACEERKRASAYCLTKQLPNDNLSLPRPPLIRSIVFLGADKVSGDASSPTSIGKTKIAVGTKEGVVRVYEPGSGSGKHVDEWQVLDKKQGSIRVMETCKKKKCVTVGYHTDDSILLVGTDTRTLCVVDASTGKTLFQYKGVYHAPFTEKMAHMQISTVP